ncbi:MAG TPA: hypothetical protein VIN10_05125 [Bacteroidales bacterium]
MKAKKITQISKVSSLILVMLFISNIVVSQTDTTNVATQDTTKLDNKEKTDSQKSDESKKEEKKKKSGVFMAYGGVTFNQLNTSGNYESYIAPGWALGAAYKRGRFVYWQVGARYNNAVYELHLTDKTSDTVSDNLFGVRDIDIPVTVGLNLLYFTGRTLGLRIYVSAVPAFLLSAGSSGYPEFSKDNLNSFNFYGQGGLGLDVLFLSIDAGYNFGFTDIYQNDQSTPGQVYVNLGFRF